MRYIAMDLSLSAVVCWFSWFSSHGQMASRLDSGSTRHQAIESGIFAQVRLDLRNCLSGDVKSIVANASMGLIASAPCLICHIASSLSPQPTADLIIHNQHHFTSTPMSKSQQNGQKQAPLTVQLNEPLLPAKPHYHVIR